MRKIGKILAYVLVGIILIPILAIFIYIALGMIVYLIGYAYYRKKYGSLPVDAESKKHKNIGGILIFLAIIVVFAAGYRELFAVQTWALCNLATFIGCLPLDYYILKKIKEMKNGKQED